MAANTQLEFLKRPNSNPDLRGAASSDSTDNSDKAGEMSYADMAKKGPKQSDEEVRKPSGEQVIAC